MNDVLQRTLNTQHKEHAFGESKKLTGVNTRSGESAKNEETGGAPAKNRRPPKAN